mmetsp:Transcript_23444/g.79800  ORF Transcript_23444/g.79800 Transcript_23444/m.79800 type:complete len:573 (+) Transcript_23444:503-2221(+)
MSTSLGDTPVKDGFMSFFFVSVENLTRIFFMLMGFRLSGSSSFSPADSSGASLKQSQNTECSWEASTSTRPSVRLPTWKMHSWPSTKYEMRFSLNTSMGSISTHSGRFGRLLWPSCSSSTSTLYMVRWKPPSSFRPPYSHSTLSSVPHMQCEYRAVGTLPSVATLCHTMVVRSRQKRSSRTKLALRPPCTHSLSLMTHMALSCLGLGATPLTCGWLKVSVAMSKTWMSLKRLGWPEPCPPKMMALWPHLVTDAPSRTLGASPVDSLAHSPDSGSKAHVSLRRLRSSLRPPKTTSLPFSSSQKDTWPSLAGGHSPSCGSLFHTMRSMSTMKRSATLRCSPRRNPPNIHTLLLPCTMLYDPRRYALLSNGSLGPPSVAFELSTSRRYSFQMPAGTPCGLSRSISSFLMRISSCLRNSRNLKSPSSLFCFTCSLSSLYLQLSSRSCFRCPMLGGMLVSALACTSTRCSVVHCPRLSGSAASLLVLTSSFCRLFISPRSSGSSVSMLFSMFSSASVRSDTSAGSTAVSWLPDRSRDRRAGKVAMYSSTDVIRLPLISSSASLGSCARSCGTTVKRL